MTVRTSVRKLVIAGAVAVIGVFAMAPMLAASAGTMVVAPPSPGQCTFDVNNVNFPDVVISGSTPVGADVVIEIRFQADGSPNAALIESQHLAAGGAFSFSYNTGGAAGGVTANYTYGNKSAYVTGCTGPGGVTVVRAESLKGPSKSLAVTGSSNTTMFVLIGFAALVLGLVFVVAARRRSSVNS
jgi:LPXTG-motif cell wall-anchored protein